MFKKEPKTTEKERPRVAAVTDCDECGANVEEHEILWSKDNRPLCPICEWPLNTLSS